MKGNPNFDKVCCEFHFVCGGNSKDNIMFANRTEVFVLNVESGTTEITYKFKNPLNRQPANFDVNDN
jgi:hypothetical protein